MANKFSISIRLVSVITSWTKKWEKTAPKKQVKIASKKSSAAKEEPKTVPIHPLMPANRPLSKRELLRDYLDEFFE